jgi:hypothetical protein
MLAEPASMTAAILRDRPIRRGGRRRSQAILHELRVDFPEFSFSNRSAMTPSQGGHDARPTSPRRGEVRSGRFNLNSSCASGGPGR